MKTKSRFLILALSASLPLTVPSAHADTFGSVGSTFTIGFVPIGNAGNANDTLTSFRQEPNYGAVPYNFNMSTFAISQHQYDMAKNSGAIGLGRNVGAWEGSQPAATVTWYQAAAFVNYLNTSTGHVAAYQLDAESTTLTLWSSAQAWQAGGENLYRNKDAYYFLPSENEYYKAAYYDPNKAGGAGGYWRYATGSNAAPFPVASGTAAGTAVYDKVASQPAAVDQSGGLSPYGTRGQTGNVVQWVETAADGLNDSSSEDRVLRGAYWLHNSTPLNSSVHLVNPPTVAAITIGFRVASVPEPSCVVLMLGSGLIFLARRRRGSSL